MYHFGNRVSLGCSNFCMLYRYTHKPTCVHASVKFQSQAHNSWMLTEGHHTYRFGRNRRIERLKDGSDRILASIEDLQNVKSAKYEMMRRQSSIDYMSTCCHKYAGGRGAAAPVGELGSTGNIIPPEPWGNFLLRDTVWTFFARCSISQLTG